MLAAMSPKLTQRTALLLIAILAMLPLQGIQAALGNLAGDAVVAQSHTDADHDMQQMGYMPGCAMHQPGAGEMPTGSHCNGGCDMCGTCSAALPPSLQQKSVANGVQLTPPVAETRQPARLAYPLFRPPRA